MSTAIGAETGLVLKVHTSNYRIEGFTEEVPRARARRASRASASVPLVNDLGSGTLVDLARFGLAHEPTVAEAIADGADLVTFSGDKLLGGPQAGFIVGRKDLIAEDQPQPDEARAARRQDAARGARGDAAGSIAIRTGWPSACRRCGCSRGRKAEIEALARRLAAPVASALGERVHGRAVSMREPDRLRRAAGRDRAERRARDPAEGERAARDARSTALAAALRELPVPVIGRIEDQALVLDLRCLEDERRLRGEPRRRSTPDGRMIVGTAGHIDHGKTALVRALTGVDTDRLKEEKARGISIDLGFAYLPAPDGRCSASSTCRGTRSSCTTCWPARPASTSCCWWWRPTTASCRRRASISRSSTCSASRAASWR